MVRLLIAMLGAVVPLLADAECTVDPPKTQLTLTPEHMTVRNALFLRLCTSAGPELVDVTDPALVGRIVFPHGLEPSENLYPRALKTTVLVALLVDTDGTVRDASLIIGSDDSRVDADVLKYWNHAKFRGPVKVDGRPVRALMYERMTPIVYKYTIH